MNKTPLQYNTLSKVFHWLTALLIIALLVVGFWMTNMANSSFKWSLYRLHKSFGLTVLALMLLRIFWRLSHHPPALPKTLATWQRRLAHSVHGLLYVLGVLMPLSGWVMSVAARHTPSLFGLIKATLPITPSRWLAATANQTHFWLAWCLVGLLVCHISGAVVHGFGPNSSLRRMTWQWKSHNS